MSRGASSRSQLRGEHCKSDFKHVQSQSHKLYRLQNFVSVLQLTTLSRCVLGSCSQDSSNDGIVRACKFRPVPSPEIFVNSGVQPTAMITCERSSFVNTALRKGVDVYLQRELYMGQVRTHRKVLQQLFQECSASDIFPAVCCV